MSSQPLQTGDPVEATHVIQNVHLHDAATANAACLVTDHHGLLARGSTLFEDEELHDTVSRLVGSLELDAPA